MDKISRTLLLVGWFWPMFLQGQTALVTAEPAIQREVLSGFTRERTRVVLSAEISGRVDEVNGDVGDTTKEQHPFACLDQTFIDLELDANRQERKSLQVDYNYFTKEVKRIRTLIEKNSSTESRLDATLRNLDKTKAQLEALKVVKRTLQEKKARHCIHAPEGWRVIRRQVESGEWINTGEPVVEIGDYRQLLVPFALNIEEYQALRRMSENLRLRLPQQDREVSARTLRVSPAFDEASRKFAVELEIRQGIDNPRGGLRVELVLDIPLNSGAVTLPESALVQRYEQYWLKRADGEEVQVVYLGYEQSPHGSVVQVVSPDVKPGDSFQRIAE
jgi:RND family efflux transporter MFP subunit